MYNQGNISLTYQNGNLLVECRKLSENNIINLKPSQKVGINFGDDRWVQLEKSTVSYTGKVEPSCEGYIIFDDNKEEKFEFSEENKEIIWTGPDARDKWIRG